MDRHEPDQARRHAAAQVLVDDPADPVLADHDAHHLARVLRLRAGEEVVAADGRGTWAICRFGEGGRLHPDGPLHHEPRPPRLLTVAFAPAKGERPEWVVQKLTELGVDRIVVLSTARTVVRWSPARARTALDRLRRVAADAAGQSRRAWLPEVEGLAGLDVLDPATAALAEPGGPPLSPSISTLAVGPEGGWSAGELATGLGTVGLGPHVLRAETAAVAAGVLLTAGRAGTVWADDR